jgi:hypothetical protein
MKRRLKPPKNRECAKAAFRRCLGRRPRPVATLTSTNPRSARRPAVVGEGADRGPRRGVTLTAKRLHVLAVALHRWTAQRMNVLEFSSCFPPKLIPDETARGNACIKPPLPTSGAARTCERKARLGAAIDRILVFEPALKVGRAQLSYPLAVTPDSDLAGWATGPELEAIQMPQSRAAHAMVANRSRSSATPYGAGGPPCAAPCEVDGRARPNVAFPHVLPRGSCMTLPTFRTDQALLL